MQLKDRFLRALRKRAADNSCTCDGCGVEIFSAPSVRLCKECLSALTFNDGYHCVKCGRATRDEGVCGSCKSMPPDFEKGASAFVYFDRSAALVNRYKNGKRYLSYYFAEELQKALARLPKRNYTLIAVPLTKEKLYARGYNQSVELALGLADLTGLDCRTDLLEKRKTDDQKQLSAKERRKNIVGAFRLKDRKFCKGKDFLVVDDVMTSSATLSEIAAVLLRAGANSVCALALAAVPDRDPVGDWNAE